MDRRTLILLAGGVICLMVLVSFVGNVMGGLPSDTVALVDTEIDNFDRGRSAFAQEKSTLQNALQSEPGLFTATLYTEEWPARLGTAEDRMNSVQADLERIGVLRDENKRESRGEIEELLARIRDARTFALAEVTDMAAVAGGRVDFKQNRAAKVRELKAARDAAAGANFSAVQTRVEQAAIDWPGKREDLNGRLSSVAEMAERADAAWQTVETEDAKEGSGDGIDYDRMIAAATVLSGLGTTVPATLEQISGLIPQLYRSWDKILTDMEIREGLDVTFHQKLKVVELEIKDLESRESEKSEREESRQVSEAQYKVMERNLGMAIEHKSAGTYDHEVESVAQPAGYAYIAPESQGRNQYGRWERGSGGGSIWVFYGQYAFMRDMFWGPRYYRPIGTSDYNRYNTSRRSGQTYYGTDSSGRPRYGTGGSYASSRYSNTMYNRSGGYRNTRYAQSGGSYRGSRYESRTTSSRGSTGRSTSRSSSRFGGGK